MGGQSEESHDDTDSGPGAIEAGGGGLVRKGGGGTGEFVPPGDEDLVDEPDLARSGTWGNIHPPRTAKDYILERLPAMPVLVWAREYNWAKFRADMSASLVVTVMLVPQAMAYGSLAGLPPIYGLYSTTIPLIVYPLFGSSQELAIGPAAVTAILSAESVGTLTNQVYGTDEGPTAARFIVLTHLLAFLVGAMRVVLSFLRAGYIVNFLSPAVLDGFVSAAGLVIGCSQLSKLLGYSIPRSSYLYETLFFALRDIGKVHWLTLLMSALNIGGLLLLRRLRRSKVSFPGAAVVKAIPSALVLVIANILLCWAARLDEHGLDIVGEVPSGLPSPILLFDQVSASDIVDVFPGALVVALVGFVESISVAKIAAQKKDYEPDPTQELFALGFANLVGAFFRNMQVTGSLSRTVINANGAETMVSGLLTGLSMSLALVTITSVFFYLPQVTLAAIIAVAVLNLLKYDVAIELWRVKRADFWVFAAAFFATVLGGIVTGILLGAAFSILRVIKRSSSPHWARLARLPETSTYRSCLRYHEAVVTPHVEIVRIDSSLYFANAEFFGSLLVRAASWTGDVRFVVLDASTIASMDASALDAMARSDEQLRGKGVTLLLASLRGQIRDLLRRSRLGDLYAQRSFLSVHAAVTYARTQLDMTPLPPDLAPDDADSAGGGCDEEGGLLDAGDSGAGGAAGVHDDARCSPPVTDEGEAAKHSADDRETGGTKV